MAIHSTINGIQLQTAFHYLPSIVLMHMGWSGRAMVLGNLQCRGALLIGIRQGPTVLAVGAGGGCLDIFSLTYHTYFLSPVLLKTARYRLRYCLKRLLNPKYFNQLTNLIYRYDWNTVVKDVKSQIACSAEHLTHHCNILHIPD